MGVLSFMFKLILMLILNLLGVEQQKNNRVDLHRKPEPIKLNIPLIIMMSCLMAFIILTVFMILIGHCTESGVYYNSHIY